MAETRDCQHGSLRRSCEVCNAEAERDGVRDWWAEHNKLNASERDRAEQQRDRLLEAVKEFIEAPPSFSQDERRRLWQLAEQIEKEQADVS